MKKSYIYAGLTVLIWSTLATVVKLVLKDIPNFQALAISSAFAFVFLLILNIINGSIKEMKHYRIKDCLTMAGLGFLGLFMYSALYYYGIAELGSQEACILNYLWPMMIVIFACIILKERITVKKIIAMLMSFAGIVVLTLSSGGASSGNRLFGIIACVTAAVCYGLFSVLNKKHSLNQNVTMMWIWFTTAVCSLLLSLIFENWQPVAGVQWLGIAWLGIVVNAVAYLLWAIALKGASDSAKIANLAYLVPFISIIISWLVLKEQITINAVLALVLIIGGILIQSISLKRDGN
ncbi:MAG: DMT family transporter [Ruminococcus sp.]|nr:DMT family transporter [Ruminococcus sp.]